MTLIGRTDGRSTGGQRRAARKQALKAASQGRGDAEAALPPASKMPARGWKGPAGLRGPARANPLAHRASSRILGAAYPFLAETGGIMRGAYIGENMLTRGAFCFDPWDAYSDGEVFSHSAALIGNKGAGKTMLAKSLASREARLGRKVAVPHDPNGEWTRVAEYVGGISVRIGRGLGVRINLLDPGTRDPDMSDEEWRQDVLQYRRATVRAVVRRLRDGAPFTPVEHTALDLALESLPAGQEAAVPDVYNRLLEAGPSGDPDVAAAGRSLGHTLRRVVRGDLAGLFDGPSTVRFDAAAPMAVVDTSALKGAAPEAQALARLATSNWVRRATSGGNRSPRLIIHEEAAVELLNDVAGGAGLVQKVEDEKVARHLGTSNWYLIHRIRDLKALGDEGSAIHTQALGLLADCDTRICYAQHADEAADTKAALGWNDTLAARLPRLQRGEGIWQVGPNRIALVKNRLTPREFEVFNTDSAAGARR